MKNKTIEHDELKNRAKKLALWGILANWEKVADTPLLKEIIEYEEVERKKRSLQRRIKSSKLKQFKLMADFDWQWPEKIDREHIEDLFSCEFVDEAANVILFGTNGLGKTMIAKNLGHTAIMKGYTVLFINASALLNDLAVQETSRALMRRFKYYVRPDILAIDEVGYLATSNEHAELLFEVITQRYETNSIILTTNKKFEDWNQVFPNASCTVTMIDRLIHRSEIIKIEGESYRKKESKERSKKHSKRRKARRKKRK